MVYTSLFELPRYSFLNFFFVKPIFRALLLGAKQTIRRKMTCIIDIAMGVLVYTSSLSGLNTFFLNLSDVASLKSCADKLIYLDYDINF